MRTTGFIPILGIALGGAAGSLCRYGLDRVVRRAVGGTPDFPWGTLVVNVLGCFAIGAVAGFEIRIAPLPYAVRLALVVGLLGGFTTFSSFGLETLRLLQAGDTARALAYVAASNLAGVLAVAMGLHLLGRV